MKGTNRIFILLFSITVSQNIFSQTIGIKAGVNLSKIITSYETELDGDFSYKPGIHAGITANYNFSEVFGLEIGILLSSKGTKFSQKTTSINPFTGTESSIQLNETTSLLYLDIPVLIKASSQIGKVKIFTTFGPYIGFGLSGKDKLEIIGDGINIEDERKIEWGSDYFDDFRKLEGGLMASIGIDLKPIQVSLSYDFGIVNISSSEDRDQKIHNRVIGLSLAYLFGKNKKD